MDRWAPALGRFVGEIPSGLHAANDPSASKDGEPEENKYSLLSTLGINFMSMMGLGPFISIPFVLAATVPPGPHAMIGYAIAALGCAADSFIWGELGSRFPSSGGSYVYLRECYGPGSWGDLASFFYVWQFWITGPAEIASGCIAIAEYSVYIHGRSDHWTKALTASSLAVASTLMLLRKANNNSILLHMFWAVGIFSIVFTLIAGFANFDPNNFQLPSDPFDGRSTSPSAFVVSLGAACRFGMYDFTGYYNVCTMGGEVVKPRTTIPFSCIVTCGVVLVVYFMLYAAVIGYLPWFGPEGFVARVLSEDTSSAHIMSTFAEGLLGRNFAIVFTLVVCVVIFGGVFSFLATMMFLPGAVAETGLFFSVFARRSRTAFSYDTPVFSLLVLGALSAAWCFLELTTVVEVITTMLLLVQFIGQSVGLCFLRWRISRGHARDDPQAWTIKYLPLVVIPQLAVFSFILSTTENYFVRGLFPLLELSIAFLLAGCTIFFVRQRMCCAWPFRKVEPADADAYQEANCSLLFKAP